MNNYQEYTDSKLLSEGMKNIHSLSQRKLKTLQSNFDYLTSKIIHEKDLNEKINLISEKISLSTAISSNNE